MRIYILLSCVALMHGKTARDILHDVQNICSQAHMHASAMPQDQPIEFMAFMEFCSTHMATRQHTAPAIPVIASDDLMNELGGDDLGEFPHKDEIAVYRPTDFMEENTPVLPYIMANKRCIQQYRRKLGTRMFPITKKVPKEATKAFNDAFTKQSGLDISFKKMSKHHIATDSLLIIEQLYLKSAAEFLIAYDLGSPCALKWVMETLFCPALQDSTTRKLEEKRSLYMPEFAKLCKNAAHRLYYPAEPISNMETLYCFSQLAIADIQKFYHPHDKKKDSKKTKAQRYLSNIMYEQACYAIAYALLQAHDQGHPQALKDAEDIMTRKEILSIIEQNKKYKNAEADTEFAAVWKAIMMRKYKTQSIFEAQSSSSSSYSAEITEPIPLPPCSSNDPGTTCNASTSDDELSKDLP